MPYDDPDPSDPMTLCGVGVETGSDEATLEMAMCFIEEYARLGFNADRILRMFYTAGYAGPALALRSLGPKTVRALIDEEMALRAGRRTGRDSNQMTTTGIPLPVLQTGG